MFCEFRTVGFLCRVLCVAVVFGSAGGCSPEYHKAEADREVYKIIDSKWREGFGGKSNYTISDVPPSPNDVQIERAVPPSGIISLARSVAMATAHNRAYQGQKEELYLSALRLTLTRHKYARQWFGTIDGRYVSKEGDEDVSVEGKSGFDHTQLLAGGVQVGTSIAIDWVRFLAGDPRTTLGSVLSASLAAPLLGSGAGRVAREQLTQAEREVLYKIRSFNRYRKSFVVSIVSDYYGVLRQRDKVANAENNYKRVAESKERLQAEAEAGRKPHFEVDQAEQKLLTARDNYVRAHQRYEQELDKFKMELSLPTDADVELDQNELKALEEIGISEPDYTTEAAIETALLRRLDLANSADGIDDAVRSVMLTADGLGVELNLLGNVGVDSGKGTNLARLQFHRGTYGLGLEADLPLDRKAQRNAYREAIIALERQQRKYENDMEEVKLNVRQAYRQLQEAAERYGIQKNSLELAEKRVESTSLLLDAGRAKTRDLLDSQDDLLEAQNNLTAALVDHIVAKLSFFRDVGILQVRPDGMWQEQ